MFADVYAWLNQALGLDRSGNELHLAHMLARTLVVFLVAVVLVRLGARRFLSHHAGFDMMVAVVLGSVLSRAINGDARFFPTLAASTLLVVLHHLLASLAFRSHRVSELVKGQARVLVRQGVVDHAAMQQAKITPDDLEAKGNFFDLEYTFYRGNREVAQVSKRWFSIRDTYGVEIAPGEDAPLILASAVVIDMISHDDKGE